MPLTHSTDEGGVCEKSPTASKTGFKVNSEVEVDVGFSVDEALGSTSVNLYQTNLFVRSSSSLSRHRGITNQLEYRKPIKPFSTSASLSTSQSSSRPALSFENWFLNSGGYHG